MTEINRIGPMLTEWTKVDQIEPKQTEDDGMDRLGLLNIYHFYYIFRAHISNF